MLDPTDLIRELVSVPGPPGCEEAVRAAVEAHVAALGYSFHVDEKGNLLVPLPGWKKSSRPGSGAGRGPGTRLVVTAHMDEIALLATSLHPDGTVTVAPLGGVHPWKWGEQPVEILTRDEPVPAILSFGSIHTESPKAVATQAQRSPLTWEQTFLFTGLTPMELRARGVRPGVRVTLSRVRRAVLEIGDHLASYFLDDRADLAVWLLALEKLKGETFPAGVLFAATVAEEVGGEGASYLMHRLQPDVCVALEIGPSVPESAFMPDPEPTVWVNDSFAAMAARDIEDVADLCAELGLRPHWQALSRGGSDASCAAQYGLTARPVTFGLPVENSHGLEIMHREAPQELARLLTAYVRRATGSRRSEEPAGMDRPAV